MKSRQRPGSITTAIQGNASPLMKRVLDVGLPAGSAF